MYENATAMLRRRIKVEQERRAVTLADLDRLRKATPWYRRHAGFGARIAAGDLAAYAEWARAVDGRALAARAPQRPDFSRPDNAVFHARRVFFRAMEEHPVFEQHPLLTRPVVVDLELLTENGLSVDPRQVKREHVFRGAHAQCQRFGCGVAPLDATRLDDKAVVFMVTVVVQSAGREAHDARLKVFHTTLTGSVHYPDGRQHRLKESLTAVSEATAPSASDELGMAVAALVVGELHRSLAESPPALAEP